MLETTGPATDEAAVLDPRRRAKTVRHGVRRPAPVLRTGERSLWSRRSDRVPEDRAGDVASRRPTPPRERWSRGPTAVGSLISPQNTLLWAKNDGEVASQRSVASQLIAAVPLDRVFADEIQHAQSRVGVVRSAYPAISSAITTAIQEAASGEATPSAALSSAETAVKAVPAQAESGS